MIAAEYPWLLLITRLPTANTNLRMRLWRAMKTAGAASLRDGVWLLPAAAPQSMEMHKLAAELLAGDGHAEVLAVQALDEVQEQRFRHGFDRSTEYAALLEQLAEVRRNATTTHISPRLLGRLRRELQQITALDFFPNDSHRAAETALAELVRLVQSGEPQAVLAPIPVLDKSAYQQRCWTTRARPWVDRLASAWLIRRFIDPQAQFLWLAEVADCPSDAQGFDFDGATFTHVGNQVTFEVLLASFSLATDPGLQRLGRIVHVLDADDGETVAEAAGLEAVLAGLRLTETDDDALLLAASRVFDSLYTHFQPGALA